MILNIIPFTIIPEFNEKKYKEQEQNGGLLGDRYAAQIRQNCNHVLLEFIIPLLNKKNLTDEEKYKLEKAFELYALMKCSDESRFYLYSYEQEKKEEDKNKLF